MEMEKQMQVGDLVLINIYYEKGISRIISETKTLFICDAKTGFIGDGVIKYRIKKDTQRLVGWDGTAKTITETEAAALRTLWASYRTLESKKDLVAATLKAICSQRECLTIEEIIGVTKVYDTFINDPILLGAIKKIGENK